MNMEKLLKQAEVLAVERRPEACLGCGFEHSCSLHGCAVIKALIEMTEAEKGIRPLTLEELREMHLREWLWVEIVHPTKRQQLHKVASGYYQIYEDYTDGEALCCGFPGMIFEFEYDEYEKNWLAYRCKPEEVQHETNSV